MTIMLSRSAILLVTMIIMVMHVSMCTSMKHGDNGGCAGGGGGGESMTRVVVVVLWMMRLGQCGGL